MINPLRKAVYSLESFALFMVFVALTLVAILTSTAIHNEWASASESLSVCGFVVFFVFTGYSIVTKTLEEALADMRDETVGPGQTNTPPHQSTHII